MSETVDLKKLGLIKDAEQTVVPPAPVQGLETPIKAPEGMSEEEYLNSPMGRIEQAIAALLFASETFGKRLDQCERYLTYLLAKDPFMGKKINAIAEAAKKAEDVKKETEEKKDDGQTK